MGDSIREFDTFRRYDPLRCLDIPKNLHFMGNELRHNSLILFY